MNDITIIEIDSFLKSLYEDRTKALELAGEESHSVYLEGFIMCIRIIVSSYPLTFPDTYNYIYEEGN